MAINVVIKSLFDDSGIKDAQTAFGKLGQGVDKAFKALTVGLGVAAAGLVKFGGDAVKAASDLQESTNAVNVAFLDAADSVLKIGESSAESLGLARTEFNQAAVRFSAFAERIVGEGGDVAGFIGDITTRAADFASVFNIDVAEALQVFQSGLAGEAEPLKRFGINLLQTEVAAYAVANGISESASSMTEAEKVQARYGLLMEQTNKTAGDFANTSDGLANSQRILRARFTDLQAEIGNALLPVVTNLFQAFGEKLLPKLEELGEFLASPQGQKIIEDTAEAFFDFFETIVDNIDTIVDVTIKVAGLIIGLKTIKTALELARTAQLLFNVAVAANPYVIAATALVALAGGMALVLDYAKDVTEEAYDQAKTVGNLEEEVRRLNEAYEDGLIPQDKYEAKLKQLEEQIQNAGGSIEFTRGELNRFNNLKLDKIRAEMAATAALGQRLANQQRQLYFAMNPQLGGVLPTTAAAPAIDDFVTGGGGAGPSAFEQVQGFIKESQKALREAQQTYTNTVEEAHSAYARDVLRTEQTFADRLADIVQQSQNRLRSAFAAVARVSLSDIFATTDEEGIVTQSVDNLVAGLRDKLQQSRRLIEQTSQLAASGFSQTFIEQVVSAGTETGNELAQAILESTPETQRELKDLFGAMEQTADTGMNSLAERIYQQQGLATQELKDLYAKTQDELQIALLDLQTQLQDKLIDAQNDFVDSVSEIREKLQEQLDGMKGAFGGLEKTIAQFMAKLDALIAKAAGLDGVQPTISTLPAPTGGGGAPIIETLPAPSRTPSPAPVINVNVKTDATQSPAMVGATVAKTISKYTGSGGGIKGIKVVAL